MRSLHTRHLLEFVSKESLSIPVIDNRNNSVDFTFISKANNEKSWLDHFILSDNMYLYVNHYECHVDVDNFSDHYPLSMELAISTDYISGSEIPKSVGRNWNRVNTQHKKQYSKALNDYLYMVQVPVDALHCTNNLCDVHQPDIDSYCCNIVNACIFAADSTIPGYTINKRHVPGWNKHIPEERNTSIFWHNMWKENGCPTSGHIFNIRRYTRKRYHHVIKETKRKKDVMVSENVANAFLSNKQRDFWTEIKKIRKCKNNTHPCKLDGVEGDDNIANRFADIYSDLYNSVGYSTCDMESLEGRINEIICNDCRTCTENETHTIAQSDVIKAVGKLKKGKHDGYIGLSTDHLCHGTGPLYNHLANLYNMMIIHSHTPYEFGITTINPIPKDKRKSLRESSNYRSIAISSPFGKLLDLIIIGKCNKRLKTSNMQFGYEAGHSTSKCSFAVNEVINYYNRKKTGVYAVLLDASKAFDVVHYPTLFNLLLNKGMCPLIVKFMLCSYLSQTVKSQTELFIFLYIFHTQWC